MKRPDLWTPQEIQLLRELWPGAKREAIATALHKRSWVAIHSKAFELQVRRLGTSNYFLNPLKRLPDLDLSEIEKVDIARMLDTEGTIGVALQKTQRKHPRYKPHIHFGNTDVRLLRHFLRLTRCRRQIVKNQLNGNRKPIHSVFIVDDAHIYAVLKAVYPYLVIKGEQATLVMEFIELQGGKMDKVTFIEELTQYSPREHSIVASLKLLNHRGVNITVFEKCPSV